MELRRITIDLPDYLHEEVKKFAAEKNRSLRRLFIDALTHYMVAASEEEDVFNIAKKKLPLPLAVAYLCPEMEIDVSAAKKVFKVDCCFCNAPEKFSIDGNRDIFYCFECMAGGDLITFVCKKLDCSAMDAVHKIEEIICHLEAESRVGSQLDVEKLEKEGEL